MAALPHLRLCAFVAVERRLVTTTGNCMKLVQNRFGVTYIKSIIQMFLLFKDFNFAKKI
jgi:hypothetical protein